MEDNEEYVKDVPEHFYESFCKGRKKVKRAQAQGKKE